MRIAANIFEWVEDFLAFSHFIIIECLENFLRAKWKAKVHKSLSSWNTVTIQDEIMLGYLDRVAWWFEGSKRQFLFLCIFRTAIDEFLHMSLVGN